MYGWSQGSDVMCSVEFEWRYFNTVYNLNANLIIPHTKEP
jgi:hypothetical protein